MTNCDLTRCLFALEPKQFECPQIYLEKGVGTQPVMVEPALLYFLRKDEIEDLICRVLDFRSGAFKQHSLSLEFECLPYKPAKVFKKELEDACTSVETYSSTRVRPVSVYVKLRSRLTQSETQDYGTRDWPWVSDDLLNHIQHPNDNNRTLQSS